MNDEVGTDAVFIVTTRHRVKYTYGTAASRAHVVTTSISKEATMPNDVISFVNHRSNVNVMECRDFVTPHSVHLRSHVTKISHLTNTILTQISQTIAQSTTVIAR